MERIATIKVDISPGKPYYEILMELGVYVEGIYKKDKKYFVSFDPSVSKTYVTDEEAGRLLEGTIS